jgi:hypothetical protein
MVRSYEELLRLQEASSKKDVKKNKTLSLVVPEENKKPVKKESYLSRV